MDGAIRRMDVSSPSVTPVRLAAAPPSFWLRLAHVYRLTSPQTTARLRVLSDFELLLQLEGRSWIWSEDDAGSVDISPGVVALLPPGFVHAWGGEIGTHIAIHFDLEARPSVHVPDNMLILDRTAQRRPKAFDRRFEIGTESTDAPLLVPMLTRVHSPRAWESRLNTLVALWSLRAARTLVAQMQAAEILAFALRTLAAEGADLDRPATGSADRAAKITALLAGLDASSHGLNDRATVAQLAAAAGMGQTSFRAAFREIVGCTPRAYLEDRRVEHAARALVETDQTVTQISNAVGYPDPYHFSRVFRRVTGASPGQYRVKARHRQAPG